MLTIIATFGVLIVLACGFGSANPQALIRVVKQFDSLPGFVFAIIVRVFLGVVAILAAPASRAPLFLMIIGGIALVAALGLLLMGRSRMSRLITWVSGFSNTMMRTWLLFGVAFGVALIWAAGFIN